VLHGDDVDQRDVGVGSRQVRDGTAERLGDLTLQVRQTSLVGLEGACLRMVAGAAAGS
jgi:hypothetical protein